MVQKTIRRTRIGDPALATTTTTGQATTTTTTPPQPKFNVWWDGSGIFGWLMLILGIVMTVYYAITNVHGLASHIWWLGVVFVGAYIVVVRWWCNNRFWFRGPGEYCLFPR